MVDKEKVVKALQCCTGNANRCSECPYDNKCLSEDETENTFFKDILEVINHYEEQVQKLEKVEHFATKTIEKQEAEIERLENEKVLNSVLFFSRVKSEAIKEFAERLKTYKMKPFNYDRYLVPLVAIDEVVKEMTEQRIEFATKMFGYSIDANKGKPTNSEFLATVADYMLMLQDHPTEKGGAE